jgi:hypothetical protein
LGFAGTFVVIASAPVFIGKKAINAGCIDNSTFETWMEVCIRCENLLGRRKDRPKPFDRQREAREPRGESDNSKPNFTPKDTKPKYNKGVFCFNCGEEGHWSSVCKNPADAAKGELAKKRAKQIKKAKEEAAVKVLASLNEQEEPGKASTFNCEQMALLTIERSWSPTSERWRRLNPSKKKVSIRWRRRRCLVERFS